MLDNTYGTSLDIGAVVFIDPPPINPLYSPNGRKQLLSRYSEQLTYMKTKYAISYVIIALK
jgi:hypothetical protein